MPALLLILCLLLSTSAPTHALGAKACRVKDIAGDDPTDRYLALLRLLVQEKQKLPPSLLTQIAKSETPLNPLEEEAGSLRLVEWHAFQLAFAKILREDALSWPRVREEAGKLLHGTEKSSAVRETATHVTEAILKVLPMAHDLFVGRPKLARHGGILVETAEGKDGALYVMMAASPPRILRHVGGRTDEITLPSETALAVTLRSPEGEALAVCIRGGVNGGTGSLTVVNLDKGGEVKTFTSADGAAVTALDTLRISARPQAAMEILPDGGRALRLVWGPWPGAGGTQLFPLGDGKVTEAPLPGKQFRYVAKRAGGFFYFGPDKSNGKVGVWDLATRKKIMERACPTAPGEKQTVWMAEDPAGGIAVVAKTPEGKYARFESTSRRRTESAPVTGHVPKEGFFEGPAGEPIFFYAAPAPTGGGQALYALRRGDRPAVSPVAVPSLDRNLFHVFSDRAGGMHALIHPGAVAPNLYSTALGLVSLGDGNTQNFTLPSGGALQQVAHLSDGRVVAVSVPMGFGGHTPIGLVQLYGPPRLAQ